MILHTVNPTSQESEYSQVMISKKPGGKLPSRNHYWFLEQATFREHRLLPKDPVLFFLLL